MKSGDTPKSNAHFDSGTVKNLDTNVEPTGTLAQNMGTLGSDSNLSTNPHLQILNLPGYEILGELGRGGMGIVLKARQTHLNREVALKMVLSGWSIDPRSIARFLTEAEAAAAVRHPHVVQVYEYGECDNRPYLAMELCSGGSLLDRLKAGRLSIHESVSLLIMLGEGIQAAHDAGIVHRDLKPGNVLFDGEGNPKIADFGLAKRSAGSDDLTRTGAIMGTPAYMAPEQAAGKAKLVGPAADVYALGVILFECLAGKTPFQDDDAMSLVVRVASEEAPTLQSIASEIPADLDRICQKCLMKDPRHRYPTASALTEDLRRFLAGEPVSVRPPTVAEKAFHWSRRHPRMTAAIAASAALVILATPVVIWNEMRIASSRAVAAEATRAQEQAEIAEQEALKAKSAAEKLASTQDHFARATKILARTHSRDSGWTWNVLSDLARLSVENLDESTRAQLRSASAIALLANDLREVAPVAKKLTAVVAARSHDHKLLALGEFKDRFSLNISILDPSTGQTLRELSWIPPIFVNRPNLRQDGITAVQFTPDNQRVIAGTRDGFILIWNLSNPAPVVESHWQATKETINHFAVSPDSKALLVATETDLLKFDLNTHKIIRRRDNMHLIHCLRLDHDPKMLLVSTHNRLHRLDLATFEDVQPPVELPANGITRFDQDSKGRVIVLSQDSSLYCVDRATLSIVDSFLDPSLRSKAHEDQISNLQCVPGGSLFATVSKSEYDRKLKLWDISSGNLIAEKSIPGVYPIGLCASGDGRWIYATSTLQTQRYELAQPGESIRGLLSRPVIASCLTGQGDDIVVMGSESIAGNVAHNQMLIEDQQGARTIPFHYSEGLLRRGLPGLSVHPRDGRILATAGRSLLWISDPQRSAFSAINNKSTSFPTFDPTGSMFWAVIDSSRVQSWSAETSEQLGHWDNGNAVVTTGVTTVDALAVGKTLVAVGRRDGEITLLDRASAKRLNPRFPMPNQPVTSIHLSPDETMVFAGTQQGELRIIRVQNEGTEKPPTPIHSTGVTAIAFDATRNWLITGGRDRSVKFWKLTHDEIELIATIGNLPAAVHQLHLVPGGDSLLVHLDRDRAVRYWDLTRLEKHWRPLK